MISILLLYLIPKKITYYYVKYIQPPPSWAFAMDADTDLSLLLTQHWQQPYPTEWWKPNAIRISNLPAITYSFTEALPGSVSSENNAQTFHDRTQNHLKSWYFGYPHLPEAWKTEVEFMCGVWASKSNSKLFFFFFLFWKLNALWVRPLVL